MTNQAKSIFVFLAAALLLAGCTSKAPPPVAAWSGEHDNVVSVRLWSDGQEAVFDDRETVDALLDIVSGFLFHSVSERDANEPGAQHTAVTLVYRDGTDLKQLSIFPIMPSVSYTFEF